MEGLAQFTPVRLLRCRSGGWRRATPPGLGPGNPSPANHPSGKRRPPEGPKHAHGQALAPACRASRLQVRGRLNRCMGPAAIADQTRAVWAVTVPGHQPLCTVVKGSGQARTGPRQLRKCPQAHTGRPCCRRQRSRLGRASMWPPGRDKGKAVWSKPRGKSSPTEGRAAAGFRLQDSWTADQCRTGPLAQQPPQSDRVAVGPRGGRPAPLPREGLCLWDLWTVQTGA